MTVTSRTPLGAPTHSRKWWVDVNTGTTGSPTWVPLMGTNDQQFNPDNPTTNDTSDNDASGYKSNEKAAAEWMYQTTVFRKVLASDATAYDPGQEFLRSKAIGKFGAENTVQIRIYEMEPSGPRQEAYLGFVNVTWQVQSGGMSADDTVQITLNGTGTLTPIAHPDTGSAIPTISSVSDRTLAAAGGDNVVIGGNRFTGTTGITFAGTACASFTVISDGLISCTAPAHAAGSGALVVTNAAGASTSGGTVTYA